MTDRMIMAGDNCDTETRVHPHGKAESSRITPSCKILTDQVSEKQVVHLLSNPRHCQQAADH